MLDTLPLPCCIINSNYECIDCNNAAVKLYELNDKNEFITSFSKLLPEYQPDGRLSYVVAREKIDKVFAGESFTGEWTHQLLNGRQKLTIDTFVRVNYQDTYTVMIY